MVLPDTVASGLSDAADVAVADDLVAACFISTVVAVAADAVSVPLDSGFEAFSSPDFATSFRSANLPISCAAPSCGHQHVSLSAASSLSCRHELPSTYFSSASNSNVATSP